MGNIAHELRTPMTTIKGFIDGMLDGTIPPENQNHYLGIVSQEVGRLTRLIKNMLDITKLEAGEYKVNATTYDIWESITSVVFGAEQRLEANNIQISGFAPTKTLVLADQDLVYQVIYNLVDNAIKFCNVGGEIRFSVTQSKGCCYRRRAQHRRGYCARGAALCVRPLLQGRQKPWAEHHRKRPGSAYLQSPHQFVRRQDLGGQQGGRILRIPVHVARAAFFAH